MFGYFKKNKKPISVDTNRNEINYDHLQLLSRYTETTCKLLGQNITIPDSESFLFMHEEIFQKEIFRFDHKTENPYIVDCGANIGISIIYFKTLYPKSTIVAFEPDIKIFSLLKQNLALFGFSGVEIINKACWNNATFLQFFSEGADGGRISLEGDLNNLITIETTRIRQYLQHKVDLLKIDIEGAEGVVLKDIEGLLWNVEKIFIEYHSFKEQQQMLPEILDILKKSGFRIHINAPGLTSLKPFMERPYYEGMDNQLNIYGYRI